VLRAVGGTGRGRVLIIEGPAVSLGRGDGRGGSGDDGWKGANELDAG